MLSELIESLPSLHPLLEVRSQDYGGVHVITWANTGAGRLCEWVEHLANLEEELHALTSQIEERRAAGRPAKRHQMTLRELMSRAHHKQNEVNQWRRSAIGVATCLGPEDVAILCTYAPLSVQSFAAHAQSNISNEGTET